MNKGIRRTESTTGGHRGIRAMAWLLEVEPFARVGSHLRERNKDDEALKRFLKRAVNRDLAPQTLIDIIRSNISSEQ